MGNRFKRKGGAKFVQLFRWLTRSEAWRACSPIERAAYLELKEKYNGVNNGQIGLSVRQLSDALHSSKDTASRALTGLQAKGFIAVTKASAFNVKNRKSTEYRLTEYGCDVTGEVPTKDFMKWRPEEKQQSNEKDSKSDGKDSMGLKEAEKGADSPMRRTVKPQIVSSQSDEKDTYRYTTGGTPAFSSDDSQTARSYADMTRGW